MEFRVTRIGYIIVGCRASINRIVRPRLRLRKQAIEQRRGLMEGGDDLEGEGADLR